MTPDMNKCWTQQPIVILDTETTGPDPSACSLLEVAAVRLEGWQRVAQFNELINPYSLIPQESTDVHGITDEMVRGCPTAAQVMPALDEFCAGAIPVAYNAPFDRQVLQRSMPKGLSAALDQSTSWMDIYVIVASKRCDKFVKGAGRLKLVNVCARRGIEIDAHRALGDALATAQLLAHLLWNGRVRPCPLGRLLAYTDAARLEQQQDFERWRARQPAREGAAT